MRLIISMHYLRHALDLSDKEVVRLWAENPRWQGVFGKEYLERESRIDPGFMTRWRNRLKNGGRGMLLKELVKKVLVNVDTTVQEIR